jgi:hypothetical protein
MILSDHDFAHDAGRFLSHLLPPCDAPHLNPPPRRGEESYFLTQLGFKVILVNARHVENVPGRKTDVHDSEWLCKLLRSGFVRDSFIPPRDI